MSLPSPTSPLSLNSNFDGSTDLQDPISAPNPPTQSPLTPLPDGVRSDHSGVPTNPTTLATLMHSNSEWEAMVVITSAQLSQNLVLNFK